MCYLMVEWEKLIALWSIIFVKQDLAPLGQTAIEHKASVTLTVVILTDFDSNRFETIIIITNNNELPF